MDFDQTRKVTLMGGGESGLDFGDLDLIFKATPPLLNVQNRISVQYLMDLWMDFDQICIDTTCTLLGGGVELNKFRQPCPNVQGYISTWKCQK